VDAPVVVVAAALDRLRGEDRSGSRRRELEKTILLWPKNFRALDDIVELVTSARNPLAADMMDRMDAAAARFDEAVGDKLKNELIKAAQGYPKHVNNCLSFLYASGIRRLSSGSPAEVRAVKDRYWEGAKARLAATEPDEKPRHAKTLSRLAAELRIAGLVGAARLMRWNGRRYRPSATAHFERLTGAGDGWYFFLVSVGSFHTFLIAVRASGEYRKYVKIEDGGAGPQVPRGAERVTRSRPNRRSQRLLHHSAGRPIERWRQRGASASGCWMLARRWRSRSRRCSREATTTPSSNRGGGGAGAERPCAGARLDHVGDGGVSAGPRGSVHALAV
jgi:hypothetical protein